MVAGPDKSTDTNDSRVGEKRVKRQEVAFLLLQAFYQLRGLLERLLAESKLDRWIQPGMGPILYALYDRDDFTGTDLAERVELSLSRITITLGKMKEKGLVTLTKDPDDRRVVRVRLTKRARSLKPRLLELRREVRKVIHASMDADTVLETKQRLLKIITSMDLHRRESASAKRNART